MFNVCFIYQRLVFTRYRKVSCQGVYAIWCRSFYGKRAFFIELYLQTNFAARWCFWFSYKALLLKKFAHPWSIQTMRFCQNLFPKRMQCM